MRVHSSEGKRRRQSYLHCPCLGLSILLARMVKTLDCQELADGIGTEHLWQWLSFLLFLALLTRYHL